jgi:phage terminase large subunit-like protein
MIDYTMVEQAIYEAAELYDLRCVGTDPWNGRTLLSRLTSTVNDAGGEKTAVNCVEIPQGIQHMSPPTKELETLIRGHQMLHVHNTCARWCFGNARCYTDINENRKIAKDRSTGRVDITVAWIIALATARLMEAQEGGLVSAIERGKFSM